MEVKQLYDDRDRIHGYFSVAIRADELVLCFELCYWPPDNEAPLSNSVSYSTSSHWWSSELSISPSMSLTGDSLQCALICEIWSVYSKISWFWWHFGGQTVLTPNLYSCPSYVQEVRLSHMLLWSLEEHMKMVPNSCYIHVCFAIIFIDIPMPHA